MAGEQTVVEPRRLGMAAGALLERREVREMIVLELRVAIEQHEKERARAVVLAALDLGDGLGEDHARLARQVRRRGGVQRRRRRRHDAHLARASAREQRGDEGGASKSMQHRLSGYHASG